MLTATTTSVSHWARFWYTDPGETETRTGEAARTYHSPASLMHTGGSLKSLFDMREKLVSISTVVILLYLAWVWGGLHPVWIMPAVGASAVLLLGLCATSLKSAVDAEHSGTPWWRDAFFYCGLLFLGYLAIQWWNAGRALFFDAGQQAWRYSSPPHPGWPSAFTKAEAAQMLTWFFPAWVLGMVMRSPLLCKRTVLVMLRALVYGAGLLALVGIAQFATHATARYWIRPAVGQFFASFGYTNHAAAFFVLMSAVAAGLLYREVFRTRPTESKWAGAVQRASLPEAPWRQLHREQSSAGRRMTVRMVALAASLLLCLVGANLSLSRAGVILAWSLALFVAGYGLISGWRRFRPIVRVNMVAATVATVCVLYFAVSGFGEKAIVQEFQVRKPIHHVLFPVLDNVNLALGGRPLLDRVALEIWRDNPVFGVGGWGYRYLLAFYVPKEDWKTVVEGFGKANVHCDVLQFLAEFGIIGSGLMLATLLALFVPLRRPVVTAKVDRAEATVPDARVHGMRQGGARRANPVLVMATIGLYLVVVFSLIDLPFRCPAILCTWVVVLAALPRLRRQNNSRHRSVASL